MLNKEVIEKKLVIDELLTDVYIPELKYFDFDSTKMLDKKIEVLRALKAGKTIKEIPGFYDILELMPKDAAWD